ncbi:MAG: hypothetical protein JOZ47_03580 [Kutzneria sp.]|nr:hypothetical protein [Kutzneria sp.]
MGIISIAESHARTYWERAGRTLNPDGYAGRAALIVATDSLATAVVAGLGERGVAAKVDRVRVDPAIGSAEVMAIASTAAAEFGGGPVIVPMVIGTSWRIYAAPTGDDLTDPVVEVIAPADQSAGDWVPVEVVITSLARHLIPPARATKAEDDLVSGGRQLSPGTGERGVDMAINR